jgi:hypothetical protein
VPAQAKATATGMAKAVVAPPQAAVSAAAGKATGLGLPAPQHESVAKPVEPPQVEERPALPPLYSAHVAAGELPVPDLRQSPRISPYLKQPGEELPTFVSAERISGRNDVDVVAEGDVELRKRNSILVADRLTYRQIADEVEAEGNVRLSRDGDRVSGPRMKMKLDDSTGCVRATQLQHPPHQDRIRPHAVDRQRGT